MGPLQILALLWRYRKLIKLVAALIGAEEPKLRKLLARKSTSLPQDAQDFFAHAEKRKRWDPFRKSWEN